MERYTQLTRNKIIMSQEPAPHSESNDIKTARFLIGSNSPSLIKRGRGMLRRIKTRKFVRLLKSMKPLYADLDITGAQLLAERRTAFLQQIEEKRGNGNE